MTINSIHNAVSIINCFTEEKPELGISEIAAQLNMNQSTIHHIVKSLSSEGVLAKTPNRRYRLGSQLLGWGHLAAKQYKSFYMATPYLESLSKRTKEISHLATLQNSEVIYLTKVEPNHPLRIETNIGARKPIHCTGLGKAMLAFQSEKFFEKMVPEELPAYTPNTITDKKALRKELEQVRKQGFAVDDEELEIGLFCIAAPVRNFLGQVIAAISISGPEFRLRKDLDQLSQIVIRTANSISSQCDL